MVKWRVVTGNLSSFAERAPIRRGEPYFSRLSRGEAGLHELAKPFDITLPAISKYLEVHAHLHSRDYVLTATSDLVTGLDPEGAKRVSTISEIEIANRDR